jgi:hypothetical protein
VFQAFAGKAEEERDAEHLATTTTPPAGVWGAAGRAERLSMRHLLHAIIEGDSSGT